MTSIVPDVSWPTLGLFGSEFEDEKRCSLHRLDGSPENHLTSCLDHILEDSEIVFLLDLDLDKMFSDVTTAMDQKRDHPFLLTAAAPSPAATQVEVASLPALVVSPAMIPTNMNTSLIDGNSSRHTNAWRVSAASATIPIDSWMMASFSPASNPASQLLLSPSLPTATEAYSAQPTQTQNIAATASVINTVVAIAPRETQTVSPSPSTEDVHADAAAADNSLRKRKRTGGGSQQRRSSKKSATVTPRRIQPEIAPMPASSSSSPLSLSSLSKEEGDDEGEIRKERNRIHAKHSRLRRKTLLGDLEQSLTTLRQENASLRNFLIQKLGPAGTDQAMDTAKAKPTERFLAQIRDHPENRVVNATTLKYLRGLRKMLPPAAAAAAAAEQRSCVSAKSDATMPTQVQKPPPDQNVASVGYYGMVEPNQKGQAFATDFHPLMFVG